MPISQSEIAQRINARMASLAAACVTMEQIPPPPSPESIGNVKVLGGEWVYGRDAILLEAIIRSPQLARYFVAGAKIRDMAEWEELETSPSEELLPPIKIIEQWDSGELSLKGAKRRWLAIRDVVQPEFRRWGKLMLYGTLTRKLQLSIKLHGNDSKYPPHVAKLRSLGFAHLWKTSHIGSIPSGRIYSQTPDGLLGVLQVAEIRQGDSYGFWLLSGAVDNYREGHFIPMSQLFRRYG